MKKLLHALLISLVFVACKNDDTEQSRKLLPLCICGNSLLTKYSRR